MSNTASFGYLCGLSNDHYTHVQGASIDFWNSTKPIEGYKGVYGDLIYNELAVNTITDFVQTPEEKTLYL